MKTNRDVLVWIKKELGPIIQETVKGTTISESLMAAIACRETGRIISEWAPTTNMIGVSSLTRGDYSQRKGEKEKIYHGYSFWQIDIDSFREFVQSGKWKDPGKACKMAVIILLDKQKYIQTNYPGLKPADLRRAMIASYNCGQGNIVKVLKAKKDIDSMTAHGDYSATVLEFEQMYNSI